MGKRHDSKPLRQRCSSPLEVANMDKQNKPNEALINLDINLFCQENA